MSNATLCPKCKRTLTLEQDNAGAYRHCLTCGFMKDVPDHGQVVEPEVKVKAAAAPMEPAALVDELPITVG
ncbi:MAG: hypothetical protein EXR67_07370 [Dehalococcoidia bacterium]|nr:hypothetical protein [Dehalococcoidia bacterium]